MEVKSFVISSHQSGYKDRDTARYAGDDKFKIPTDVRKKEENKITKIYISKRLYKKDPEVYVRNDSRYHDENDEKKSEFEEEEGKKQNVLND